jgi:hypothetical protein
MDQVPVLFDRGAAFFLLTNAILLVAAHTALSAEAARRAAVRERRVSAVPMGVAVFLAGWLAAALVASGSLPRLPREVQLPLAAVVGFGPMLVAVVALFSSRSLRAVNEAMPAAWPIWAQSYRMAGFIFLFPFLAYGVIPAAFAVPAAVGDMLTGALAVPVGRAIAQGRPGAAKWAVAWNILGIVDLIVAPASAIGSQANVFGLPILAIIPLFLGPPLGILVHVFSLRNLVANARPAAARSVAVPAI